MESGTNEESVVNSGTGIGIIHGPDLIFMNPVLQRMAGYEPETDFRRMSIAELAMDSDNRNLSAVIADLRNVATGQPAEISRSVSIGSTPHYVQAIVIPGDENPADCFIIVTPAKPESVNQPGLLPATELYRIVHDLKAPVRAIRSLVDWIAEECRSLEGYGELKEFIELLGNSAVELNDKIESILKQTRI